MMMKHRETGFPMGDPEKKPFENQSITDEDIKKAVEPLILSASGWRKVFASDGDEESRKEELLPADRLLAAAMAEVYADFILERCSSPRPVVVLGLDARFTGPALGDVMIRVLLSRGIDLRYLFICAAPEIMAYTGHSGDCDGFIYISASHNPIGHNGVKFGLNKGGVLSAEDANILIQAFKALLDDESTLHLLRDRADNTASGDVAAVFEASASWKEKAREIYSAFSYGVISGREDELEQLKFFSRLSKILEENPLGIVAELNGSARSLSIDEDFFSTLGVQMRMENARPRQIAHRIVPEGSSLDLCRRILEDEAARDSAFKLGYVPDNDGDRGNLVYYSPKKGGAEILEAQEVFALCVLSELAFLYWSGTMSDQSAVVANGPTSGRIDRICEAFGCTLFRAEVGEANAVNLAREKREAGWQVRILGEGSNGGNITFPAAVRDPLNTLGALLKLLLLRGGRGRTGLFEIWCHLSGQGELYRPDFDLDDVIASLPAFTTTSAYEERAIMKIQSKNQGALKARYEEIFQKEWEEKKVDLFNRFGIADWQEWNTEGTVSRQGVGKTFRRGRETGGLTIRFLDSDGKSPGFLWMRGSGTEPVFRVLADWQGRGEEAAEAEAWLLDWHKSMIARADALC